MSGSQSGDDLEMEISDNEMIDQPIENWKRCTNCNRPVIGHGGGKGRNCSLEPMEIESPEMKEYERKLKERTKD